MVGSLSIAFTRKAVVNEKRLRESANVCESILGIDSSQFYRIRMYHEMPYGLCTPLDLDPQSDRFRPRQK